MCGILGTNFLSNDFKQALEIQNNRGPDYQKSIKIDDKEFGHNRLAIIDLNEEANQPMVFDDILIVFNGEIYNYKELIIDEELECKTVSDTEVLIRLYQKYETDFLNKINGMFSFCIYDMKKDKYFCARDRYGKKPFFYYFKDNKFIFASSIKSVLKLLDKKPNLNKVAVNKYLQYFVSYGEDTFYHNIFKLEAATYFIYEPQKSKELLKKRFYKINTYKKIKDEPLALKDIEELLFKSVESRLVSDVEVGCFLSGGLDSSLIAALGQEASSKKMSTFTISYSDNDVSEGLFASRVADILKTDHFDFKISDEEIADFIMVHDEIFDEPFADYSQLPTAFLCFKASEKVKVCLSGDGADELFGGYNRHHIGLRTWKKARALPAVARYFSRHAIDLAPIDILQKIATKMPNKYKYLSLADKLPKLRKILNADNIDEYYLSVLQRTDQIKKYSKLRQQTKIGLIDNNTFDDDESWIMASDFNLYLPDDILVKLDRSAMAFGLETRAPFLDVDIINFSQRLSTVDKIYGSRGKLNIRECLKNYLPEELIERPKQGFGSPLMRWLRGPLAKWADNLLETDCLMASKIWNVQEVQSLWQSVKNGEISTHYDIWHILMLQTWLVRNRN